MTGMEAGSDNDLRVVCGAIVRGGKVLAALRGPGRVLDQLWELPGGKVEPGEDDASALARELFEELRVTVQVGPHLGTSRWAGGKRPLVLVAYRCALPTGEPQATEHRALAWLGPDELHGRPWAPADVPLLAPLQAALLIK